MSVSLAVSGVTNSHRPKTCCATSTAKSASTSPPSNHGAPRRLALGSTCVSLCSSARSDILGLRVYHAPRPSQEARLFAHMTLLDIFLNRHDRLRSGWRLGVFCGLYWTAW